MRFDELVEDDGQEVTTEVLIEKWYVLQQRWDYGRSSLDEEEYTYTENHHPYKSMATRATHLFYDNVLPYFCQVLKRCQKQVSDKEELILYHE